VGLEGEILESLEQAVKQGLVEVLTLHVLGLEATMGGLGQLGPSQNVAFVRGSLRVVVGPSVFSPAVAITFACCSRVPFSPGAGG